MQWAGDLQVCLEVAQAKSMINLVEGKKEGAAETGREKIKTRMVITTAMEMEMVLETTEMVMAMEITAMVTETVMAMVTTAMAMVMETTVMAMVMETTAMAMVMETTAMGTEIIMHLPLQVYLLLPKHLLHLH